jgi:hypothetical protein
MNIFGIITLFLMLEEIEDHQTDKPTLVMMRGQLIQSADQKDNLDSENVVNA